MKRSEMTKRGLEAPPSPASPSANQDRSAVAHVDGGGDSAGESESNNGENENENESKSDSDSDSDSVTGNSRIECEEDHQADAGPRTLIKRGRPPSIALPLLKPPPHRGNGNNFTHQISDKRNEKDPRDVGVLRNSQWRIQTNEGNGEDETNASESSGGGDDTILPLTSLRQQRALSTTSTPGAIRVDPPNYAVRLHGSDDRRNSRDISAGVRDGDPRASATVYPSDGNYVDDTALLTAEIAPDVENAIQQALNRQAMSVQQAHVIPAITGETMDDDHGDDEDGSDNNKSRIRTLLCLVFFVVVAAAGVALGVTLSSNNGSDGNNAENNGNNNNDDQGSGTTIASPTLSPTLDPFEFLKANLIPGRPIDEIAIDSSQYKSLTWLVDTARMNADDLYDQSQLPRLTERYVFGVMYYEWEWPEDQANLDLWLSDLDVCAWRRVECDEDGFVHNIDLLYLDAVRTLPSEIGLLTQLTSLYLLANKFLGGTVPTEIGQLTALLYLDVDESRLSGTIPSEIGQLTQCTLLSFDKCQLNGPIPSELGMMEHIEVLSLGNNDLTGAIPTEIGNLSRLESMRLSYNRFDSSIPSELANLSSLRFAYIEHNQLTGTIPAELSFWNETVGFFYFELFGNRITGTGLEEIFCAHRPADEVASLPIQADCLGPDPEIICSCCNTCCNADASNCQFQSG